MLDANLIERALGLTWKTKDFCMNTHNEYEFYFDDAIFFKYILSPEFLEKYPEKYMSRNPFPAMAWIVWLCIYEYQAWNETPLVELLNKI